MYESRSARPRRLLSAAIRGAAIRTGARRGVSVLVAVLVLVGGLGVPEEAGAVPTTTVAASSTAQGTDAPALARGGPHAAWRSADGRTRGVVLTTRFARATSIDGTTIRGTGVARRIVDARLEFSDGSALAVRTDAKGSRRLAFPSRTVRWVRLVVASAAAQTTSVELAGWTLRKGKRTAAAARTALVPTSVTATDGEITGTRWRAENAGPGGRVKLRFATSTAVSAVRLVGAAATAEKSVRSGYLRFSDGSRVVFGALEPRGGAPTTIAFTPRITHSVAVVVTAIDASAKARLASVKVFPVGVTPPEPVPVGTTYRQSWKKADSCSGIRASAATAGLVLLCPSNGSEVGRTLSLVLSGPAGAAITATAWQSGGGGSVRTVARGEVDDGGTARLSVSTAKLMHGPSAVRVVAAGVETPLYVQFMNRAGVEQKAVRTPITRGMDLKFDEDFTGRLSATRSGVGATYASGKPNFHGSDDFGEAIFAQPSGSMLSTSTMPGGYLRIPARALRAAEEDPVPYGRRAAAGLISSGHLGGSGFSAQYGYFEARMLAPGGAGAWPAFWMLSTGSLWKGGGTSEVDAIELYGAQTLDTYQTAHNWLGGEDRGHRSYYVRLSEDDDSALFWHTYGARIGPNGTDFYVDGTFRFRSPRAVHAEEPFFFLANLALTPGWQDGLAPTRHRVDLYIDSIRVWV